MADKEIHDFEVLPPEGKRPDPRTFSQWVAWVMDELFTVPGTRVRFGLDPLMGLLPGWGESSASVLSIVVLLRAAAEGVPKIVLIRMALNILLNAGIGVIPVLGDAFSVWFKSNRRNQILMAKHSGKEKTSTRADWIFVMGLLGVLLALLAGIFFLTLFMLALLVSALRQHIVEYDL